MLEQEHPPQVKHTAQHSASGAPRVADALPPLILVKLFSSGDVALHKLFSSGDVALHTGHIILPWTQVLPVSPSGRFICMLVGCF